MSTAHRVLKWVAVALLAGLAVGGAGAASADIEPGNLPAGSIQTAYPIQPNTSHTGAF